MFVWDEKLFFAINRGLVSPILDILMPLFSAREGWIPLMVGLFLLMGYYGGKHGRYAVVAVLIAVAITDPLCAQVLKPLIGRVRPCYAMGAAVRLLAGCGGRFSFPSNHAANAAAVVAAIGVFYKKSLWIGVPIAIIVGFSRIYIGVHYPSDVFGGWVIGTLVGVGTALTVKKFEMRYKTRRGNENGHIRKNI